jgi:uncharacterized delta-60 repeat protein
MVNTPKSFHGTSIFFLLIHFLFLPCFVNAQATQEWVARYNPLGADTSYYTVGCKTDAAGNVYVAGYSQITGNDDALLLKYNTSGVLQWKIKYNGSANNHDRAVAMTIDNAGYIYITGYSYTNAAVSYDCITLKYNSSGLLLWEARYDYMGIIDRGNNITVDNSGNVFVTGYGRRPSTFQNDFDYITLKYNSSGMLQWASSFSSPDSSYDIPTEIALDNIGNIYVSGQTRLGNNTRTVNFLTIKYNSTGAQQWTAIYNGPSDSADRTHGISVDNSGNVYVGGDSRGSGTGYDGVIVKYSNTGVQQWVNRYNGTGNSYDGFYEMAVDANYIYVTGMTTNVAGNSDCLTLKYNFNGAVQWVTAFNSPVNLDDWAYQMTIDNSGNSYIVGGSFITSTNINFLTIKYNSSGVQQWFKTYDHNINLDDDGSYITLDAANNVIVTGYSLRTTSGYPDIATIKYSQLVGITPVSSEIPISYSLSQNYPNPFNPVTTINFSIPSGEHIKLTIYDILGNEVSVPVNESLAAGSYKIDYDASKLPSGVYFYKLSAGSFTDVKKMILAK